jgi:hypothetical protein
MGSDWQQHDRPAACLNAQQYSSANFVSLSYYNGKEKLSTRLKNTISISLLFFYNSGT